MEIKQNFKIEISKELNDKLVWLTTNYDNEVGAWLVGEITNEKIIIEDFLIPEQEVSGGSVDTDGKALVKLRKEYGDKCLKIIGHWHSHNSMSSFWSGDDEKFIDEYTSPREMAVFIVSSIQDGHKVRLEINKPIKLSLDDLEYEVIYENSELEIELKDIISKKLKETSVVVTQNVGYSDWNDDLTQAQIGEMIMIGKNNQVVIKNLTTNQFEKLDGAFPFTQEVIFENGLCNLIYKTKTLEKAKELMKDLENYMLEEFEDKGYSRGYGYGYGGYH